MAEIFNISRIDDCKILELPIVHRISGNITSIENLKEIPFEIKRVYYLYDIPGGVERGGHAHKELFQLIVAASGAFDVEIFDGNDKKIYRLDRPNYGLFIVPGIWRDLKNFSSGSICVVLASLPYSDKDYIRSQDEYINIKLRVK